MPIFEYTCEACGKEFERYLSSRTAVVICPACESRQVAKRLSTFSTQTTSGFSGSMGSGCGCAPSG